MEKSSETCCLLMILLHPTHKDCRCSSTNFHRLQRLWADYQLEKTNVLRQDTLAPFAIALDNYKLDVVKESNYLGSIITENVSSDNEIKKRIGKAATAMADHKNRFWKNTKLTMSTKMAVYNACVVSTLMYGSETWTTYARQELRLNTFHMRNICHTLEITWQDRVTNLEVLLKASLTSMFTLLSQCR